jgi:hypothetical protein
MSDSTPLAVRAKLGNSCVAAPNGSNRMTCLSGLALAAAVYSEEVNEATLPGV